MNLFEEIALSPEEKVKAIQQGLVLLDHSTKYARVMKATGTRFDAETAKQTIRLLEGKLSALQAYCEKQERIAYLNLTGITTIKTDIEAKIAECETLKNDRTQMVCDAAIEAFKETLELISAHQAKMEGME